MTNNLVPKIRFEGFHDEWEITCLGTVLLSLHNGQTPSRSKPNYWGGTLNWLTSGELNRNTVFDTHEKITPEGKKSANLKVVPKGTVVIAITGLEAAGTRGSCAKLGMDTTLNQSCMALIPNSKFLVSSFLFQWYLKVGNEYGEKYTQGTKQQSYNAELIKKLPINLPCVNEQEKIADFIGKLGNRIALHQRQIELLRESKQGFLQKMFPKDGESVPEVRFDGFSGDWSNCEIRDIVTPVIREVPKPNESYTRLSVRSHAKGTFHQQVEDPESVAMTKLYIVRKDDLIVNITFAWEHAIAVAAKNDDGLYVSHRFPTYRSNENSDIDFIRYLVTQKKFKNKLELISPGGAGRNRVLNKKDFLGLNVTVPIDVKEQEKIGEFFKKLDDSIATHEKELELLKETKKGFLQKMFV